MKSSSLLSTFSSFSSGTAVVKTNTPNTAAANLKAALAATAAATNPTTTSTTPPQSVANTTSKLTTNALINLNNNVNNGTTTTSTAPPINLKISLKMELLPNEKLYPTPSMQDGLLFEDEFDLRLIGCELIQTAGRLLKLPQVRFHFLAYEELRFYFLILLFLFSS